jgi:hypothetical protein
MKRRKLIWIAGALVLAIVGGFILEKILEKRNERLDKERLLHALDLKELPSGTKIVATAYDIWTDYVVHFVVEVEQGRIKELLSSCDFESPDRGFRRTFPYRNERGDGYTSHLPVFDVYHYYSGKGEDAGLQVETNADETLAYVLYMSD